MRMVLSMYESRGNAEPMAGIAVKWRTPGVEVLTCAPSDCPELLVNAGAFLVRIGGWR